MELQMANSSDSSPNPTNTELCKIHQVPIDIMKSILERFDIFDTVQAKAVCRSWNSLLGEEIIFSKMPLLIFHYHGYNDVESDYKVYNAFLILKPRANQIYRVKRNKADELRDCCCIGSSKGWMVFLGKKLVISLFHPLRQIIIQLPSLASYARNLYPDALSSLFFSIDIDDAPFARQRFIKKVILMKQPDRDNNNYSVILLCPTGNIVYHRSGSEHNWDEVVGSIDEDGYEDINSSSGYGAGEAYLFALSNKGMRIDGWYFQDNGSFRKGVSMSISSKPSCLEGLGFGLEHKLYYVESCGDILLVARLFKDTKTQSFHVYRLAPDKVGELFKWVEMESLGNRALFVGGNQSISVLVSSLSSSNFQGNSIYYTHDSLENSEDMGVYNLSQRQANPVYRFYEGQGRPPPTPCWVLPPTSY